MKLSDPLLLLGLMDPCEDGSMDHDWRTADLPCDQCGDHGGFMCTVCWEAVDFASEPEAHEIIDKEMP